jgi:dihydroxyacetone synthase
MHLMRYSPDWYAYLKTNTLLASLTQGIANAIGLVVASEHFAPTYNKPNFDNKIWCSLTMAASRTEALSCHLRLDNLIIYDDNPVSCSYSIL